MKKIIGKLDFIKIKHFCSARNNVKRMRRQVTDWDQIFAKDTPDKELLFKLYKELLKQKENKQLNLKMGQGTSQTPHQGDTKITNKMFHM